MPWQWMNRHDITEIFFKVAFNTIALQWILYNILPLYNYPLYIYAVYIVELWTKKISHFLLEFSGYLYDY
jgi:hypothetical protein